MNATQAIRELREIMLGIMYQAHGARFGANVLIAAGRDRGGADRRPR